MAISYEEYQTRFRMMEKDMHKFYDLIIKKGIFESNSEILGSMGSSMRFLRNIEEAEYNRQEVKDQIIINLGILKNHAQEIGGKIQYFPKKLLLKIDKMIRNVRAVS